MREFHVLTADLNRGDVTVDKSKRIRIHSVGLTVLFLDTCDSHKPDRTAARVAVWVYGVHADLHLDDVGCNLVLVKVIEVLGVVFPSLELDDVIVLIGAYGRGDEKIAAPRLALSVKQGSSVSACVSRPSRLTTCLSAPSALNRR